MPDDFSEFESESNSRFSSWSCGDLVAFEFDESLFIELERAYNLIFGTVKCVCDAWFALYEMCLCV